MNEAMQITLEPVEDRLSYKDEKPWLWEVRHSELEL